MRFALILALIIAVVAVGFAVQNPGEMDLRVGPYLMTGSKAFVLLVTFAVGALVGILAALPGRWAVSRRARKLEKERLAPAAPRVVPTGIPEEKIQQSDPYTERFGSPPHTV